MLKLIIIKFEFKNLQYNLTLSIKVREFIQLKLLSIFCLNFISNNVKGQYLSNTVRVAK